MSSCVYDACSPSERVEAIEQLGALISATTAELLSVIGSADRAEDWKVDGATGMASWLVDALRVSAATARDGVEAARQLEGLPAVREAFGEGVLTWEQVRPATRFVTPENDGLLARELQGCSVAQIEAMARRHRPRHSAEELEAARVRRLRWRADHVLGGFHYRGFLPTEMGELVNQVFTRIAEGAGPDPDSGVWDPFEVRVADALVELARVRVGIDPDPETCLVVIHTDAEVVDGHVAGNGMIGDLPVARESVLRALCDCKVEFSIDGPDGTTIGIGRADRRPPRWLRRKIANRDGTCRFPGCGRVIRHRHHLRHWTNGGPLNTAASAVGRRQSRGTDPAPR